MSQLFSQRESRFRDDLCRPSLSLGSRGHVSVVLVNEKYNKLKTNSIQNFEPVRISERSSYSSDIECGIKSKQIHPGRTSVRFTFNRGKRIPGRSCPFLTFHIVLDLYKILNRDPMESANTTRRSNPSSLSHSNELRPSRSISTTSTPNSTPIHSSCTALSSSSSSVLRCPLPDRTGTGILIKTPI
jgi:hypothetical protein